MRISFQVNGQDPGNYRLELWETFGEPFGSECHSGSGRLEVHCRFERERLDGQPDDL